jgi:hypothetical protein
MRTTLLATTMMAFGAVACSSGGTESVKDDFSADLKLASATTMNLAAPAVNPALLTLENAPKAAPQRAPIIKKAPEGERAVQSEAPTVAAEPEPTPAAVEESEPVATAVAPAPVPQETNEPVAVAPRPTPPAAVPSGGRGAGDYGTGGGVFGGGVGVVIRGGGVGEDHCVPRRGGRGVYTGGIYVPRPTAPVAGGSVVRPRVVRVVMAPR